MAGRPAFKPWPRQPGPLLVFQSGRVSNQNDGAVTEGPTMASEIPVVRYLVACQEVIVAPGRRTYTLREVVNVIQRLPGEAFPCVQERMALFALLTSGRGKHQFTVELTYQDQGQERTLVQPPPVQVDLGQDPIIVHGLPIPLSN